MFLVLIIFFFLRREQLEETREQNEHLLHSNEVLATRLAIA
jgi:hypothetical protein